MSRGITDKLIDPLRVPAQPDSIERLLARERRVLRRCRSGRVVVAADHLGARLAWTLSEFLVEQGLRVSTFAPDQSLAVHGPHLSYALWAAPALAQLRHKEADWALLVCGNGKGMLATARAWPGMRPHLAEILEEVRDARRHNDANVLCLGARLVGRRWQLARLLAATFVATPFRPDPRYVRGKELIAATAELAEGGPMTHRRMLQLARRHPALLDLLFIVAREAASVGDEREARAHAAAFLRRATDAGRRRLMEQLLRRAAR